MYTICLFRHHRLGANDEIEHCQIGSRLTFDAARGRLWVVCPQCARWNLTPIEERWEAIEECERSFRAARVQASTDEIAGIADGLLVPPQVEVRLRGLKGR